MKLALILSCQHLSIFSSATCLLSVEQIHFSLVLNISRSPLYGSVASGGAHFLLNGYSARNVILTSAGPRHRLRLETPAYLCYRRCVATWLGPACRLASMRAFVRCGLCCTSLPYMCFPFVFFWKRCKDLVIWNWVVSNQYFRYVSPASNNNIWSYFQPWMCWQPQVLSGPLCAVLFLCSSLWWFGSSSVLQCKLIGPKVFWSCSEAANKA